MGFVQNLRMRNLFPVRDTGLGQIPDIPMQRDEIINSPPIVQQSPRGIQAIGNRVIGRGEPLQFGGVVGEQGNPGADILNRSRQSAEQTYANYGKPLNQQTEGISNDEAHLNRYFDRKNKETIANAQAEAAGMKGWKTVTITDPNDPSKQINAQINERTGETRPIQLDGGVITRPGSAKDMQANIDAKAAKEQASKTVKTKAQEALDVLNSMMDDKGQLSPDMKWITGLSANFGTKYTPGGATANASVERLKNLLTLGLINEMKKQSRTGATGFGQMNLRELGVLEDAASKLGSRNMREEDYAAELGRIRERLNQVLQPDTPDMKPVSSHTQAPQAPKGFEYVRRPDNKGWTAVRKVG